MTDLVGRALSAISRLADGVSVNPRRGRYGEAYVVSLFSDMSALCEEGSVFSANSAQTGIATGATPTAFSATNPFLTIYNGDSSAGKYIILDSLTLIATAAGTAGASVQVAVTVDSTNRFTSGGTALTPKNCNMDSGVVSIATVNAGNITAPAASSAVRTVVGNRYLKGAIPVAGDEYVMKFGATDAAAYIGISTILKSGIKLPPVILGPGHTALVHLWLPSQSAASSYIPELSWIER